MYDRRQRRPLLPGILLGLICGGLIALIRAQINSIFLYHGIPFAFTDALILIPSAIGGIGSGLVSFLVVLVTEFLRSTDGYNGIYALSTYLLIVLASAWASYRGAYHRVVSSLFSAVAIAVMLAFCWFFTFTALLDNSWERNLFYDLSSVALFLGAFPEIAAGTLAVYLFFHLAPERVRNQFAYGWVYSSDPRGRERRIDVLGRRVTAFSLVEALLLCLVAILCDRLSLSAFPEELPGGLSMLERSIRLGLLMMCAAVPLAYLLNQFILAYVVRPINALSRLMDRYFKKDEENRARLLPNLPIHTGDEIERLYRSLRKMVSDMGTYMDREIEHQRDQDRLKNALEVEKAAGEAKTAFFSSMTHEIRSPINAVLGMNEMILREARDPQIREYASNVRSAGTSLLNLVNDVLDMSKIEAGKMDLLPVDYRLASLINDLVVMISARAEAKGLAFTVEANPTLPSGLHGDDVRLKQVITNLLTNGVKYTERGSVTLCFAEESREDGTLALSVHVRDTGIGIKNTDREKLFAPFERIEEDRNRNIEGTGLGMNITTRLLTMMGSRLEVDSVYGEGSDFHFVVAQQISDPAPLGDYRETLRALRAEQDSYRESFTAPEAKILVVDDTPMNLLVIQNLLKQTQVQVETVESGRECLELIGRTQYDAIFLDDRMPEMSGTETLRQIQTTDHENQGVPVIVLTANSGEDTRSYYLSQGFTDYLAKPIEPTVLEELLARILPPEKVRPATLAAEETREGPDPEALSIYLDAVTDGAAELEALFAAEDWKNYTIKVHALKSTSRLIGEQALGDLAEKMEAAGDAGDLSFLQEHHRPLLNWYVSLLVKYRGPASAAEVPDERSLFSTTEAPDERPLLPPEEAEEARQAIRELAAVYDDQGIGSVLDQLSVYRIPPEEQETWERLRDAFRRLDWEFLGREDP